MVCHKSRISFATAEFADNVVPQMPLFDRVICGLCCATNLAFLLWPRHLRIMLCQKSRVFSTAGFAYNVVPQIRRWRMCRITLDDARHRYTWFSNFCWEFKHIVIKHVVENCTPFHFFLTCNYSLSAGAKIDSETSMMYGMVVKKDTASCDSVHVSSRAKVNAETNMRHSTVVKKDNAALSDFGSTKRQGFQHIQYGLVLDKQEV